MSDKPIVFASFRKKLLVWFNVGIQILSPLAVAFTPAVIGAGSDKQFLQSASHNTTRNQVYTLSAGETVSSVAKKYNMTLDELRKLNQFRTFAKGFDNLQMGDELDVPGGPSSKIQWDKKQTSDAQAHEVAGIASKAGGILASRPNGDAAASMARGIATGAANSEIQQWMSRFGTARVQLDANKNFSLKNSQLDLLVPFYEQDHRLAFTQGSLHRTDDRAQSNIGIGYRQFYEDWMLGGNVFLDYDLSRDFARLGLGVEYWRDFLKLSANSYHRLTEWKNSRDFEDYKERPANGWDLRLQAWLPALPQLGGKLTYEQYYGKEVALFGKGTREQDPHAFTFGVNYTPIPLLTFNAEQRKGKSGQNDTRFGADLNYQIGVPWQRQIKLDAAGAPRSLLGSRYDLVERNNNIVLEYRKKDVIHLRTADLIAGYAGEQKTLDVSVNSKYGLERIDWSISGLLSAGGKVVQNGVDWAVVLPNIQTGPDAVNTYTVSAVAVDKKGNVSQRADTQVTVIQAAIDSNTSTLSPANVTLPANGKAQQLLTLLIRDRENNPVDIAADEISAEVATALNYGDAPTVTDFTRTAAGEYVATLTAGNVSGLFTVAVVTRNMRFSTQVTTVADDLTAWIETLEAVADNAIANGQAENKIKVKVVDANNIPVPAQAVSLKADNEAFVPDTAETDEQGEVTVPVTSIRAGETAVTASINGNGTKDVKLTFRADSATAWIADKDLTVTPDISMADGTTPKTISVKVMDAQGNPVPDMPVALSADNGAKLAETSVKTDAQGQANTTLTSTFAGISYVTASVNQAAVTRETTFIGHTGSATIASVYGMEASGIADGITPAVFQAVVTDKHGNLLSDMPVDWTSNKDDSVVVIGKTRTYTDENGVAETPVTSTKSHADVVITASIQSTSQSASPFAFVADKDQGLIKQFTSDRQTLTANGVDPVQLVVQVRDVHDNPLEGVTVMLSSKDGAAITPEQQLTDKNGFAFATLITTKAGEVNIDAKLNNGAKNALKLKAEADAATGRVTVTADSQNTIVGQPTPVILTAKVVDANSNPLSGAAIAWKADRNQLGHSVSMTNAQGDAVVALKGTEAVTTTVTAMLYNGNEGSTQVDFAPGTVEHGKLSISPNTITADGNAVAIAELRLTDRWNNPVPGQHVDWSSNEASIDFTAAEKGQGIYQANVTGTKEGIWAVIAKSGKADQQVSLGLLASQNTAQIDSVQVIGSDTAKANGVDTVAIRVQVKDQNGNNKLPGVAVGWDSAFGNTVPRLSYTNDQGIADVKLSSTTAGKVRVTAMLGGGVQVAADKDAIFTAGSVDADTSSLSIRPANIVAEKENTVVTVIAKDAEGNLLPGLKNNIELHFTPDLSMSMSTAFDEISSGVYAAKVTGRKAGTTDITAEINGVKASQHASLTIMADKHSAVLKGAITVTPGAAVVGQVVTYSAVLVDNNGNALGAGIPVTWNANEGSKLAAQVTITDSAGKAKVTLTREKTGTAEVKLILPSGNTSAPDVAFSAEAVDESRSELTLSPATIAAGKEVAILNLFLRDKYDNPLTGQVVSGQKTSGTATVTVERSEEVVGKPGHYAMNVSGTTTGTATLSVKVNNKTFSKTKVLTVKGDVSSWKITQVLASKNSIIAGDVNGVTYSATVVDANGNKLPDMNVSWHLTGQSVSYDRASRTDQNGVAKTQVRSNTAGELLMTALLDDKNSKAASKVMVSPADVDDTASTFGADKKLIGSDGKEKVTFTVHLKDQYGNVIPGKVVAIQNVGTLPGLKLTKVNDMGGGNYVAEGSSNVKGTAILRAQVDKKTIGKDISVDIGAITPELRFANKDLSTVWAKSYTAQQVTGVPGGVRQMWSVSDESVASVNNSGGLTLHKSGKVTVTVQTSGNTQYNPAQASYDLTVDKASPKLTAVNKQINASWADGKDHRILVSFSNADVDNLKTEYFSDNGNVVVVNKDTGVLSAVKPGVALLTIRSPATERFNAESVDVSYILNKGTVNIKFNATIVDMSNEKAFVRQDTVDKLPSEGSYRWSSSDSTVINLTDSGDLQGNLGKGMTRLTLFSAANDYFNASHGFYDAKVYAKPEVELKVLKYKNKGAEIHLGNGDWTPVYTGDSMYIQWGNSGDEYVSAKRVTVKVVDDSNVEHFKKVYDTNPGHLYFADVTPKSEFWGKKLQVRIEAEGFDELKDSKDWTVSVKNLEPHQIWQHYYFESRIRISSSAEWDAASCQDSGFGREHQLNVDRGTSSISFNGNKLIAPMSIRMDTRMERVRGGNGATDVGTGTGSVDVSVDSDQMLDSFQSWSGLVTCFRGDTGLQRDTAHITYAGKTYKYVGSNHNWAAQTNLGGTNVIGLRNWKKTYF
ncbi:inverse autotransporter beta-barrel domain-containing protein [Cedecea neteri]|uniref:inverse autotransporter beta-barrel domain-containing protein n=1 Tax=Cedecea neteri TaxID=158822 RepID=UPI00068CD9C7|nr:inverse autotransporter beta-barrel domain-containing protein [Cedecea neteri]